jgi:catechol 2,3-dioxygenase-like lactoylglutathione lyase family enzyme
MLPFQVRGIDHVVLRCTDLGAMLDFYCGALGLSVAKRNDALGLVHLHAQSAMIDLVSLDGALGRAGGAPPGAGGRNMDHLCLRIDPFDLPQLTRYFEERGIAVKEVRTRFGLEGDGISFYLEDPGGNRVELKGPAGK